MTCAGSWAWIQAFWTGAKMDKEFEKQLIDEKIKFTRLWVERMLNSTNKKWSTEQKNFVNALYKNAYGC